MKKLSILLVLALLLTACNSAIPPSATTPTVPTACATHADVDNDNFCDQCQAVVVVSFDIYAINDLHGKIADSNANEGVDELSSFLRDARAKQSNVIVLSSGDMWQGSAESNITRGNLTTDWMNAMDFSAMTLGNHEFDWGEEPVAENADLAEFPLLAINIYDRQTNQRVEYCQPSVLVDSGGVQIGIIGAIGDCYSSIAAEKVEDIYFKTGATLTQLVKDESQRLRDAGADFIIYSLHDGYETSTGSAIRSTNKSQLSSYYDTSLSDGYVDLVFEAHTHQSYRLVDEYGVYHLQNGGDNNKGISSASIYINTANGNTSVSSTKLVSIDDYKSMQDDPIVDELLEKYKEQIAPAYQVIGTNSAYRNSTYLRQTVADLYYQAGLEKWGDQYDIVLGGGFISVRSPYYLEAGQVTYGMLQSLLPFDNELVLCSIKGRDLQQKFFESTNKNYFISYDEYGSGVKNNIDPDGIYYVVVDTYSASYAPNRLTVVAEFGPNIFARDLLADYIADGGYN